jgi:transposase, IS5 family
LPDAQTILLFREKLTRTGAISQLFGRFVATLRHFGDKTMSGQIVYSNLIAAPRQHNSNEKNVIKEVRAARATFG